MVTAERGVCYVYRNVLTQQSSCQAYDATLAGEKGMKGALIRLIYLRRGLSLPRGNTELNNSDTHSDEDNRQPDVSRSRAAQCLTTASDSTIRRMD